MLLGYGIFSNWPPFFERDGGVFTKPPWLYSQEDIDSFDAEMELMNLLGIDLGEEYISEVLEDDGDFDFSKSEKEKPEEVKVEESLQYSNDLYPKIEFEYSSLWKLTEELKESELVDDAKNLTIIMERDDYVLRISTMVMPPMGLEGMCYEKNQLEYTRIGGDVVRVVDERGYTFGHLYDDNHEKGYFNDLKELNRVGTEDFIACGDINILKTTESSYSNEYGDLGAIVSVILHERGEKSIEIISDVDDIILSL